MHGRIGIKYPCHFSFAGSVSGAGTSVPGPINFLDKLCCIATGNFFSARKPNIFLDWSWCHLLHRQMERLQWRICTSLMMQGHYFILVYFSSKTDSTFAGCFVLECLTPLYAQLLHDSVISFNREAHTINCIQVLIWLSIPSSHY